MGIQLTTGETLTISQINRAGRTIRSRMRDEGVTEAAFDEAVGVLLSFREAHSTPLVKANMGLRSAVHSEGCRVEVSQRLKRTRTMVDKLAREPTMALANMQDIGGCRAVLDSIEEVRRVQSRLVRRRGRTPERVYDYIGSPRQSGYRGVHVIVKYDDRRVEIQLRTRVMHEWAIHVERLSGRVQADLKSGSGPRELLDWLEVVSRAMALEEEGIVVDSALVDHISELRTLALAYLEGGRT